MNQVSKFDADLGGTEIYKPLELIFQQPMRKQFRQVFLLTDGAVSNTQSIVDLVAANSSSKLRVHSFGIGSGVSTELVKETARAGNGMAYFIADAAEIEKKVIDSLCVGLIPYLKVQRVDFLAGGGQVVHTEKKEFSVANGSELKRHYLVEGAHQA